MPRITIERRKKVGKLTEIVKETYEIPELLNCNKCGSTMECDHGVYTCLYCKNQILATDYVENLLKENAEIDKTDNARIDM